MQRLKYIYNFTPNFINYNKVLTTKKCNQELMCYIHSVIYNKSDQLIEMTSTNGIIIGMSIGSLFTFIFHASFLLSIIPSILVFAIGYRDTTEVKKELFDANSKRDIIYNFLRCDSCNDCSKNN